MNENLQPDTQDPPQPLPEPAALKQALAAAPSRTTRVAQEALAASRGTAPAARSNGSGRAPLTLSVVIAAADDARTIRTVVRSVRAELDRLQRAPLEVLVVDDGSTDGTAAAAEAAGARVIRQPNRIGHGAAVKTGIRAARGELLVLMDGDEQHRPEHLERLIAPLEAERYDMVVAARGGSSGGECSRGAANRIYRLLASYVAGRRVPDLTSGYRVVRRSAARRFLYLLPNTLDAPATLTLSLMRAGLAVRHVPIRDEQRPSASPSPRKIRLIEDGARFLLTLVEIATLCAPLRVFVPLAAAAFVAGIGRSLFIDLAAGHFTNLSLFLYLTSFHLFAIGVLSEQIARTRFLNTEDES